MPPALPIRNRYLSRAIEEFPWSFDKMAFVSGPRQCGKTTLARVLLAERERGSYRNWDDVEFRRTWVKSPKDLLAFSAGQPGSGRKPLLVLDEIHKARAWKRTLKGMFDTLPAPCDILVTGSARLGVYQKGSDSLLGRYMSFRLHPFSLGELEGSGPHGADAFLASVFEPGSGRARRLVTTTTTVEDLLRYGGFPEPFLRQSMRFVRIWRRGRLEKLVREDLRDLTRIPELSRVEMLMALLPERVGSRLSVQALREDLEVAHTTVRRWIDYLRELYYAFEIKPYSRALPRSLKKEGKLYLWDWSEVENPGSRYENLVACHLLKAVHFWTDTGEGTFELHYLRDKEKREVDFLITRDRRPWLAVECKESSDELASGLRALLPRMSCPRFVQLVRRPVSPRPVSIGKNRGIIMSAESFLVHCP